MSAEILPTRRQKLADAVENLYETFCEYQLEVPLDGCPPLPPEKEERLQTVPLRQLSADDLVQYAFRALTTVGSEDDFKHFLPRILEIAAQRGSVGRDDLQIVLGKLQYGQWTFWPQRQRQAVEHFLWAFWESVLGEFSSEPDISTFVCGFGCVVDDLKPFLDVWSQSDEPSAINHLHNFIESNLDRLLKKHRLRDAFWSEREPQMMQVILWLAQPELGQRLEQMSLSIRRSRSRSSYRSWWNT